MRIAGNNAARFDKAPFFAYDGAMDGVINGVIAAPGVRGALRSIPPVNVFLEADGAREASGGLGRENVKKIIEDALEEFREEIKNSESLPEDIASLARGRVEKALGERTRRGLRRVINATGIVIHTNLGRAPLPPAVFAEIQNTAASYSTLEYDCEAGGRGNRNTHIEWIIRLISGAEAALAVNNNAAAVLLALQALAAGREVIVSAGELVEIGDSFRIPEILSFSGAKMVSAGCTNSVKLSDYKNAITENTALILKVHPSNYKIEGFVKRTGRRELAALAGERGLVFMEDLGSGLLCPLKSPLADEEHSVRQSLEEGAHIVTFSGDKLLGGPQIGVIAGKKSLIGKMKRHPLLRALRVDKMTLSAFESVLRLYLQGKSAEIPVISMIEAGKEALRGRARNLCRLLRRTVAEKGASGFIFSVVETFDAAGGGAFPAGRLPGSGVSVRSASKSAEEIAALLRAAPVPVIAGIQDGEVILHVRTIFSGEEKLIAEALARDER